METENKKGMGWVKQAHDSRDIKYAYANKRFKRQVDLRCYCPDVYDQKSLGSCSAFATSAAIEMVQIMYKTPPAAHISPSKLFMYYVSRKLEGTIKEDAGAVLRDVFKAVNTNGFVDEIHYPYIEKKFADEPSLDICRLAQMKNIIYHSVDQNLTAMRHCLSSGKPIVVGFSVYSNLDRVGKDGILTMPDTTNDSFNGGHAVLVVGYDYDKRHFIVRNSWSNQWGDKGYFYMPFDYLLSPSLAADFWTVDLTE